MKKLDELGYDYGQYEHNAVEGLVGVACTLKDAKDIIEFDGDPDYPTFLSWLLRYTQYKGVDYPNRLIRKIADAEPEDRLQAARDYMNKNNTGSAESKARAADLGKSGTAVQIHNKRFKDQRPHLTHERRIEIIQQHIDAAGLAPHEPHEAKIKLLPPEEQVQDAHASIERLGITDQLFGYMIETLPVSVLQNSMDVYLYRVDPQVMAEAAD